MRVIVAGDRTFTDYEFVRDTLDKLDLPVTEIVSGCARGVDTLGERYAEEREIPVRQFPAEWDKYGKAAGPIRNKQMAEYGDSLVAFLKPTSKGTKNMIETAHKLGLTVHVINVF
jgi:hypothetical protein